MFVLLYGKTRMIMQSMIIIITNGFLFLDFYFYSLAFSYECIDLYEEKTFNKVDVNIFL